ncbi:MAG: BatA domain-containing protein [Betaproteobacteria bacterium]|nr:BatA domain-containing protein [Betaproteobacteria bacterium]
MNFAVLSTAGAFGLIAAVAVFIGLLYLIRPRTRRITVASTVLWQRIASKGGVRKRRWRWLLSLLLSLAIGLCLVLALTHLQLPALEPAPQRITVILDNSASMGARTADGRTRWQHALDASRRLILQTGRGAEVLLLDTAGRAPLSGFLPASEAVERLGRLALSPEARTRVPPLPTGAEITDAYLFTDGVGVSDVPKAMRVHPVFEPADNVGITAFTARPLPADPARYSAFLQITNAAGTVKRVSLEVVGADGFRIERQLDVGAASTANLALDVSSVAQGPLRAHIATQGDAFDLDDTAYCVVSAHRIRHVVLVTRGNPVLEDSLRALPGIALTVRSPSLSSGLPSADAYVFDGNAPPRPPDAGALLFRPLTAEWLGIRWKALTPAVVTGWDDSDPLTAGVDWARLRPMSAFVGQGIAGAGVVTAGTAPDAAGSGALIMKGRARSHWIAVGFSPQDSNFPLQPGFPIFLGNALARLTGSPDVTSQGLGYVEAPLPGARVTEGGRQRIAATTTGSGTLFEASRPGVYVVEDGKKQLVVVANAIDPHLPQINRRSLQDPGALAEASTVPGWNWPEPWEGLLALAFGLLAFEWAAFSRRVTE